MSDPFLLPTTLPRERLAATYARQSKKNAEGLVAQFLAAKQRAEEDGFHIPDRPGFHFGDDDTTGVATDRQAFDALKAIVVSGDAPFSRLYIKDATRFTRVPDPRWGTFYELLFEQHGVQICYVEDKDGPIDYANADPSDFLGRHLKKQLDSIVASEERLRLIRRVTGGMRARVLNGFFPGGIAPYGLKRVLVNRLTGHVEVAEIPFGTTIRRPDCHFRLEWATDGTVACVKKIFHLYEQGWSMRRIAAQLNADGIPSRRARQRGGAAGTYDGGVPGPEAEEGESAPESCGGADRWKAKAIRDILTNPIYCGDLVWGRGTRGRFGDPVDVRSAKIEGGKEALIAIDFVPNAPITREQWRAIQSSRDGNSGTANRRASRPEYLLTGLVYCTNCGVKFHGHTNPASRAKRRYYRHNYFGAEETRPHVQQCPARNHYVPAEALEAAARAAFEHVLSDDRLARLTREELERRIASAASLERQRELRESQQAIEQLKQLYLNAGRRAARATDDAERAMFEEVVAEIGGELKNRELEASALEQDVVWAMRARERQTRSAAECADLLAAVSQARPEEQKRLLASVVERVRVSFSGSRDVPDEAEIVVRSL